MKCVRPCGCFTCPHPDCICDEPPSRAERRLAEMIDRDAAKYDAEAKMRERQREKARAYYAAHKAQIRERQLQYYNEHKADITAYARSWYKKGREAR